MTPYTVHTSDLLSREEEKHLAELLYLNLLVSQGQVGFVCGLEAVKVNEEKLIRAEQCATTALHPVVSPLHVIKD